MRLPIGLAVLASLFLLGSGLGASPASAPPSASDVADPASAWPPTDTYTTMNTSVGSEAYTSEINACVSGAPGHLPDGTNATAFCTCAVDKMLTHDIPQRDAVNQCARAMHITLPNQE